MLEISTSNFTSAIDYGAYSAGFMDGVDWADRTMIERACDWLDTNLERYVFEGINGKPYISVALLDELRHDIS